MRLLALDTATAVAAVGVVSDVEGEGPWEVEVPSKNHAPTLMRAVDDALLKAGVVLGDIDGVAVGVGPGSFTGVRIGVATARALAFAAAKPIWGVSTLEAMARRAGVSGDANGNAATGSVVVVVAIPSRHGEVFAAAYKRETVVMAPRIVATAALDSWIAAEPRPVARVGVGGTAVGPRARDIASLAFAAASQRPSGHGDALAPTYLAAPPVDAAVLARYRP